MKALWKAGLGALVLAACLVAGSGAAMSVPSGDTCTVTGSGTSYTVAVTLPANAQEQGAFAFGGAGGNVTNIVIPATPGALATTGVPANTSAMWVLNAPAVPGQSITASLVTSAPITGSFTLVPSNGPRTAWFDPVACSFPKGTPVPSNKFTVKKGATYDAKTGTWREAVVVPGPGKVIFAHRTIVQGGTPRPLIKSGKVSVSKAGQVMLTLRPTAAGAAALGSTGRIKLSLNIEFSPTNGKPANKLVSLTLSK
jgi:hypothetical protein